MEAIEIVDSTALEFDEFGSMKLFDLARALFFEIVWFWPTHSST